MDLSCGGVLRDVQRMGLDALRWYEVAQDRSRWYDLCQTILSEGVARRPTVVTGSFVCSCGELLIALEI